MQNNRIFTDLLQRYPQLNFCKDSILASFDLLCKTFSSKHKLLIAGNGGSASDADHISGELLKAFFIKKGLTTNLVHPTISSHLQHALPAIPLANFHGFLSAFSNDCEPEWCFAQLTYALGQPQDCLLAISTSGNSKNILNAAKIARNLNLNVLGLSGHDGGELKNLCDVCICVPEAVTFKIQELHLPIYHTLCLMLEDHFYGCGA